LTRKFFCIFLAARFLLQCFLANSCKTLLFGTKQQINKIEMRDSVSAVIDFLIFPNDFYLPKVLILLKNKFWKKKIYIFEHL